VLLNLFNNAFYAVNERKKIEGDGFKPEVRVETHHERTNMSTLVVIRVSDNGPGIPESVKQKIFQPFFTTKPTGEGTGLGLSLSYDIIKAHGGRIECETNPEGGTLFTIQLPDSTDN
jgi:signal transduction histidine kinase